MGRFSFFFFSGDTFFSQVSLSCVYDYEEKKWFMHETKNIFEPFVELGGKEILENFVENSFQFQA